MRRLMLWVAATAALACPAAAMAQPAGAAGFAAKPLRMLVPVPAGGPSDFMARQVAQHLSTSLGQVVAVENRPGANGLVPVLEVVFAPVLGLGELCWVGRGWVGFRYTFVLARRRLAQVLEEIRKDYGVVSFVRQGTLYVGFAYLEKLRKEMEAIPEGEGGTFNAGGISDLLLEEQTPSSPHVEDKEDS